MPVEGHTTESADSLIRIWNEVNEAIADQDLTLPLTSLNKASNLEQLHEILQILGHLESIGSLENNSQDNPFYGYLQVAEELTALHINNDISWEAYNIIMGEVLINLSLDIVNSSDWKAQHLEPFLEHFGRLNIYFTRRSLLFSGAYDLLDWCLSEKEDLLPIMSGDDADAKQNLFKLLHGKFMESAGMQPVAVSVVDLPTGVSGHYIPKGEGSIEMSPLVSGPNLVGHILHETVHAIQRNLSREFLKLADMYWANHSSVSFSLFIKQARELYPEENPPTTFHRMLHCDDILIYASLCAFGYAAYQYKSEEREQGSSYALNPLEMTAFWFQEILEKYFNSGSGPDEETTSVRTAATSGMSARLIRENAGRVSLHRALGL